MDSPPSPRPVRKRARAVPETGAAELTLSALLRVFGLFRQSMDPHFSRFGISGPQWAILRVLVRDEAEGGKGVPHREIGRRLFIQPPSVTAVVDRLERQGLVRRGGSTEDLRVRPVALTAAGRKLVARIESAHGRHLDSLFGILSESEHRKLRALLGKLGDHMETQVSLTGKPARSRRV